MYCIAFLPTSETLKYGDNYSLFYSKEEAMLFLEIIVGLLLTPSPVTFVKNLAYSNSITRNYVEEVLKPLIVYSSEGYFESLTEKDMINMFSIQEINPDSISVRKYQFGIEVSSNHILKLISV